MKISAKQSITIETLEQLDAIQALESVASHIGSGFAASDLFNRGETTGLGDLFVAGEHGCINGLGRVFVVRGFDAVDDKWIVEDVPIIPRIGKFTVHSVGCGYPSNLSLWSDRQKTLFVQWWNCRAEELEKLQDRKR